MAKFPANSYQFRVEWGGRRNGFSEVTGLDMYFEPIQYRSGDSVESSMQSIPGMTKFNNIILKRHIENGDDDFIAWMQTKQGNDIEKRDVVISLLNESFNPIVVWRLKNAYPIRYSGPILNAYHNKLATEELELAHDGLSVEFLEA